MTNPPADAFGELSRANSKTAVLSRGPKDADERKLYLDTSTNFFQEAHDYPVSSFIAGQYLDVWINFTMQKGIAHGV